VPAAAESGALEFRNLGQPALFSALTLIAEGQVNTFDTPFDRLETSLFTVTDTGTVGPAAMRFTGDGEGGFSALLFGGERLLLTRQALLGGRSWTARIEATSYTGLSCGFLASSGDVLLAVPCAAVFRLDASGIPQVPGAFFVEAERELASVEVSAVALASDLAPDDDGDGIADVLDDCPGVNDPSQNGCTGDAGAGMAPAQDAGVVPDQPRPDAGSGGELTDAGAPLEAGSTPPARFDAGPVGAGGGVSDIPPATGGSSGPSPEPTGSNRVEPSGPAPSSTPSPVQSPSPDAGVEGRTAGKDGGCGCRVGEPVGAPRFGWLWLALFTTLLFRRARVSHGRRGKRLARSCG
jgi:MYXO-CTERM domain-containing protein